MEKIPDGISFEEASFVEPLNTVLKAVNQCDPQPGDTVLVIGQGPIGLMFTMLMAQRGARVLATDTIDLRLALSLRCGSETALDPRNTDVATALKSMTDERCADLVVIAVSAKGIVEEAVRCSRPGARIMLFAQTSDKERIELSGASICVGERTLLGSYSASVDIQREGADLIFQRKVPVDLLISHRFPLDRIKDAFHLALHPTVESLKVIVQPQRCTE
jgi:L-iditol 2-dehydrogenase